MFLHAHNSSLPGGTYILIWDSMFVSHYTKRSAFPQQHDLCTLQTHPYFVLKKCPLSPRSSTERPHISIRSIGCLLFMYISRSSCFYCVYYKLITLFVESFVMRHRIRYFIDSLAYELRCNRYELYSQVIKMNVPYSRFAQIKKISIQEQHIAGWQYCIF